MHFAWKQGTPLRPDRYIDWLAQVSKEVEVQQPDADDWAPVAIRLLDENYFVNVEKLIDETKDSAGRFRATTLERNRLRRQVMDRIADQLPAASQREFYIYMRESDIYVDGQFNQELFFEIRAAGPPIDDLALNDPNKARGATSPGDAGTDVAIGIIDDGIAFAHERFRNAAGSRIRTIWLQDIESNQGFDIAFGRRIIRDDIDEMLSKGEKAVYRKEGALDFAKPGHKGLAMRWSHGTHVLDLAAGAEPEENLDWPIFAVQLPGEVTLDTSGTKLGSYALQGLRYIMNEVDELQVGMPLVVNFSYGTLAGPKDGQGYLEREIDRMIEQRYADTKGKTFVVLPTGNSRQSRANARVAPVGVRRIRRARLDAAAGRPNAELFGDMAAQRLLRSGKVPARCVDCAARRIARGGRNAERRQDAPT